MIEIQTHKIFPSFPIKAKDGKVSRMHIRTIASSTRFKEVGTYLWNESWSGGGWDLLNPIHQQLLGCVLQITSEDFKKMHSHAPQTIFFSFLGEHTRSERELKPGDLIGQIWGIGLSLRKKEEIPLSWDLVTAHKTFSNATALPTRRECVSVYVKREFNGYRVESSLEPGEVLSVGQVQVKAQFVDVIRSPSEIAIDAYSRPSTLKKFVEMIWELRNRPKGKRVMIKFKDRHMYDENDREIFADSAGIYMRSESENKFYLIKVEDKIEASIQIRGSIEDGKYILMPGDQELITDEKGIYLKARSGDKEFLDLLVDIPCYLNTSFDQMKRFHGGIGGIPILVLHNGRILPKNPNLGDLISLNYNVVYNFDVFRWLTQENYERFLKVLNKNQQALLKEFAWYQASPLFHKARPQIEEIISMFKENIDPKIMVQNSFTLEKIKIIASLMRERNLIDKFKSWKVKEPSLKLDEI